MARPSAERAPHQVGQGEQHRALPHPGRQQARQVAGGDGRLARGHGAEVGGQVGAQHRRRERRGRGAREPAAGRCDAQLVELVEERERVALAAVPHRLDHAGLGLDALERQPAHAPLDQVAALRRQRHPVLGAGRAQRLERLARGVGLRLDQHQRRGPGRMRQPRGERRDALLAAPQVLDLEYQHQVARAEERGALPDREDRLDARFGGAEHVRERGLGAGARPGVAERREQRRLEWFARALDVERGGELRAAEALEQIEPARLATGRGRLRARRPAASLRHRATSLRRRG